VSFGRNQGQGHISGWPTPEVEVVWEAPWDLALCGVLRSKSFRLQVQPWGNSEALNHPDIAAGGKALYGEVAAVG